MLFPEMKIETGASFSPDGIYRYSLWRIWNKSLPLLGGLLLNPSTADAMKDDPTVSRMGWRARQMGFGGLIIANIFAYRSTDPEDLYHIYDPIGFENDVHIAQEMKRCKVTICGWGKHGNYMGRGISVLNLLRMEGITPYVLGLNGDGTPKHPLYLSYAAKPVPHTPWERQKLS